MPDAYYNEIDLFCCQWLGGLANAGEITPGRIDERSIADVTADDVAGVQRCHFFAGIGGWELALRLAGWPDSWPVWTGSCPCQPFSCAGKGKGEADERHLWPELRRLIAECHPPVVFGEQVASSAGREWLARVRADWEVLGYAVGAADLCAASTGAPHIRQRLFWVADAAETRYAGTRRGTGTYSIGEDTLSQRGFILAESFGHGEASGVADAEHSEPGLREYSEQSDPAQDRRHRLAIDSEAGGVGHAKSNGREQGGAEPNGWNSGATRTLDGLGDSNDRQLEITQEQPAREEQPTAARTGWSDCYLVQCLDGKQRRVGAEIQPLAHGIPRSLGPSLAGLRGVAKDARRNRVGRLRGYGNAIVPEVAAEFVRAFIESTTESEVDEEASE